MHLVYLGIAFLVVFVLGFVTGEQIEELFWRDHEDSNAPVHCKSKAFWVVSDEHHGDLVPDQVAGG